MSKITCMEAIVDTLFGPITSGQTDEFFDVIVKGCMALATGEATQDNVIDWIVAQDKNTTEVDVCLAMLKFFRWNKRSTKPSEVLDEAVAAGKAAL